MKFEISNLGYLDKASIELGNLTVVCGFNNTGKTYLSYAIWGFFEHWQQYNNFEFIKDYYDEYTKNGIVQIDLKKHEEEMRLSLEKAAQDYGKNIQSIFNIGDDFLIDTSFCLSANEFLYDILNKSAVFADYLRVKSLDNSIIELKKQLGNDNLPLDRRDFLFYLKNLFEGFYLSPKLYSSNFIITSERTGISLFLKELDKKKSEVVDELLKKQLRQGNFTFDNEWTSKISKYAEPIQNNIDWIRYLSQIAKGKSFLFKQKENKQYQEILELWDDIMQGSYKITEHEIFFVPKEKEGRREPPLPMYASASAVKSLLLLDVFIKHSAQSNSILFIDEPELNLHPEVQRKLADLFVRLSNVGIKVFITTHSDYLMKELNNLIMLSNIPERKDILEKYGYSELSILKKEDIKAYVTENHTLNPIEISDEGLETDIFDATALRMNQAADDIYYANK